MTRKQYQETYGTQPQISNSPKVMTRQQYQQTYGQQPQVDKSVGGFIKNLGASAVNNAVGMVGGIAGMVNPDTDKNTLYNMGRLAYGGLQKLDRTKDKVIAKGIASSTPLKYVEMVDTAKGRSTDYQPQAEAVGKFYANRYGGIDQAYDSLYNDPVGVALDVSTLAGGGAGLAKLGGLGETANVLGKVARVTDPVNVFGKVGSMATSRLPKLNIGQKLADLAETMPTRGMGNPSLLGEARGMSPIPMNELFEKYNLWGRTPEDFASGISKANSALEDLSQGAEAVGTKINKTDILQRIDKQINEVAKEARYSDAAKITLDELIARRSNLQRNLKPQVKPSTVTKIKGLIQKDVPDSQFGLPTSETAKAKGAKTAYKQLLESLEKKIPGTKGLGREESALYKLKEIAESAKDRTMGAQPLKLKGLMTAGGGLAVGGIPGAIGGYLLNEAVQSPTFLKYLTKGLEGASKVKPPTNIFKELYKQGKIIRMLNR